MARRLPLIIISLIAVLTIAGTWWTHRAPAIPVGNLSGSGIGAGHWAMTDQNGRRVTDADLTGQYRLMYFGYTYCPDVCPLDAQHMGAGLKAFEKKYPEAGARVTPVFVTVDPERDTPAKLKAYLAEFHERFVGLTGTPAETDRIKSVFKIYSQKQPGTAPGAYLVDHMATIFLIGPDNQPIQFVAGPSTDAAGIERLLEMYVP